MLSNQTNITSSQGFSYALIACAMAALTLPVYILVPQVYADTLGLGLGTVGIVLLIARIFDMLTDPVAGWLSDQYPIKGRHRRPWILVGMVITAVGAWGVLSPFTDMVSPLYLGVASVILYAGWTLINIPLYALGTELSGHEQGRRRLAAWREIMVLLGTVLTLLIVGSFSQEPLVAMTWVKYFTLSVGFAGLVLLWRLPKPIASRSPKKELRINDYFSVFKNKDFRHLLSAYIINGLANGLPATTFLLFVQQVIKAPEYQGYFLLIYFVAGLLAAPIWVKLANKYSHPARIWCIAMIWACSIFMLVGFTSEGTIWLYGLICIGSGLSLGADMILPSALQAEVVAKDREETQQQRGGIFFAWWGMATKLALALAVGIAFPFLDVMGCTADSCDPVWAMKVVYAGVPLLLKALAIWLMWSYHAPKSS